MGKYNTRGANKRVQRNVATKENCPNVAGPDDETSANKENKRKRKVSKTSAEYEKEAKRIKKPNTSHDTYCWKCKKIESEIECFPEVKCSTCVRAFHTSCLKSTRIDKDRICYVCQQQSSAKTTSNIDDEIFLSKLLLHIIDTACPMDRADYKQLVDWQDSKEHEKLINKKDFRLIHDKCFQKGIQYESYVELVDDIEWIHHNCVIVYGEKSPLAKNAKKILLTVQGMLKDALDCPECYYKKIGNDALAFLNICKTPHPLVWAKVKGWSYWPAKCLKASKDKANVRFFYTHQIASVPLSNVLAMSEEYPSASKTLDKKSKNNMEFIMSMSELNAYIGIFKDNYGTFPYEPINTSFDFEKEEKIMTQLAKNHSRRMIVTEDAFLPSDSSEPESYPAAVVDLTETENGEDQAQEKENVDPIILHPQDANLFENAPRSTTDTNNSDNVQSLMDAINNDSIIKTGFQHSMDSLQEQDMAPGDSNENILGNQREFQAIQQAISGSLLPSQISDHNNMNWLTQGISISNVISGTDVPSNSDLAEDVHCGTEPALQNTDFSMSMPSSEVDLFQSSPALSQNSISSSNSMEVCVTNYGRASGNNNLCVLPSNTFLSDEEDIAIIEEIPPPHGKTKERIDIELVMQNILKYDPRSYEMLQKANHLVQDLFIQFWGTAESLRSRPAKTIQGLAYENQTLKAQLAETKAQLAETIAQLAEFRQEINRVTNEKFDEKIQNAGNIVRILRAQINSHESTIKQMKKENERFEQLFKRFQQDNERLTEEVKRLTKDKERMQEDFEKQSEKAERLYNERIKEAKTNKYCDVVECFEMAKHLCCYSGLRSYAYCSEKCKTSDDVHRRTVCKSVKRADTQQLPEEKEVATSEQVVAREVLQQHSTISSFTYTIASIQSHTNKEITSSSSSPQTSSGNIQTKKVVKAKKTFEVAKNINRSSNADIF